MGRRFGRGLLVLAVTGLAVEAALIPIALFHFHRAGLYGVAANIVAIPLTTFVLMPLEALALILDTVGAGGPLWWLVDRSIASLLWLAHAVAAAKGAVAALPSMPIWAFASMVAGGLWICIWEHPARRWGLVAVAIGALGAATTERPDLLITGDGKHLAVIGADGRPALLRARTGDYVRDTLSEAAGFDGDPVLLDEQKFGTCSRDACIAAVDRDGRRWQLLATRSRHFLDWRSFVAACAASDIVVSDRKLPDACTPRWLKLDRLALERSGGLAIRLGAKPQLQSVAERVGDHPWRWLGQSAATPQLNSGGSGPPAAPGS